MQGREWRLGRLYLAYTDLGAGVGVGVGVSFFFSFFLMIVALRLMVD